MANSPKKIVDPTEAALSAIQEALKVRDDEDQPDHRPEDIPEPPSSFAEERWHDAPSGPSLFDTNDAIGARSANRIVGVEQARPRRSVMPSFLGEARRRLGNALRPMIRLVLVIAHLERFLDGRKRRFGRIHDFLRTVGHISRSPRVLRRTRAAQANLWPRHERVIVQIPFGTRAPRPSRQSAARLSYCSGGSK